MMNPTERETALREMNAAVRRFYVEAARIGHRPFIEFAGVMTAYLNSCERAHADGIDFSDSHRHGGTPLPIEPFELAHLAEKLGSIFSGRIRTTER
jgi:hypothetical protein